MDSTFRSLEVEKAVTVPIHDQNLYGEVEEGAYLVLRGAYLLDVVVPAQVLSDKKQTAKEDSEPLMRNRKQVGVFFRDTITDIVEAGRSFLLVLQEEPLCPLSEHPMQLHQSMNMISTVMGIVVVIDETYKDAFRRVGLARWIDEELLKAVKPRTVKLV